jgi:8-oxo-dGTP pyrophosphatase MutT (NUDIX family)
MNPKLLYVGVKGVIINSSTKKALILIKKDQEDKYFWDIPGGRINNDEDIITTLHRELKEEIPNMNNEYQVNELIHAYRLSKDLKDGYGLLLLFYKIECNLNEVELSSEHEDYKWISLEELETLKKDISIHLESGYITALELALTLNLNNS